MPAFARSEPNSPVVEFARDGGAPETQLVGLKADRARAGERALVYAIGMLINRRPRCGHLRNPRHTEWRFEA